MTYEDPLYNLDVKQSEELIFTIIGELGIEKIEDVSLKGIKVEFEQILYSKDRDCDYLIDDENNLRVWIKDIDLSSGVKLIITKIVDAIESNKYVKSTFFDDVFIHSFYPVLAFVFSLMTAWILGLFNELSYYDTMTIGLILFTVIVLPVLAWNSLLNRNKRRDRIEEVSSRVMMTSIISNIDEARYYAQLVSKRSISDVFLDFAAYLTLSAYFLIIITPSFL